MLCLTLRCDGRHGVRMSQPARHCKRQHVRHVTAASTCCPPVLPGRCQHVWPTSRVAWPQLWDTGDALQCRRLGRAFWQKAGAFLCVCDLSNAASLRALDGLHTLYQDQVPADS